MRKHSYESYVNYYRKKEAQLNALGFEMDAEMFTKKEYLVQYDALKNYRKKMGMSQGNVNRDLANDQAYESRSTQAVAKSIASDFWNVEDEKIYRSRLEKFGKMKIDKETGEVTYEERKLNLRDIQKIRLEGESGENQAFFFNKIKERYQELRSQGLSAKEAMESNARYFFASYYEGEEYEIDI